MFEQLGLGWSGERLVVTLSAFHSRLGTYTGLPLVVALRRPPTLALRWFLPALREDILATAKEISEQRQLALRRPRIHACLLVLARVIGDRPLPLDPQLGKLTSYSASFAIELAQPYFRTLDRSAQLHIYRHPTHSARLLGASAPRQADRPEGPPTTSSELPAADLPDSHCGYAIRKLPGVGELLEGGLPELEADSLHVLRVGQRFGGWLGALAGEEEELGVDEALPVLVQVA